MDRREVVGLLAAVPLAAVGWAPEAERAEVLDDIAWPRKAKPQHAAGVAFFNTFRDLTASGFFSSRIGVQDLRYIGNTFVSEWKGCPPEALAKLGVRYED